MDAVPTAKQRQMKHPVLVMYLVGFIFGLHVALPAYITSTFLSQFAPEKLIGIIYALASLLTIVAFSFLPHLLRRHGNFKVALGLLALDFFTTLALAIAGTPILAFVAFIVSFITIAVLGFTLDIFLEHSSRNNVTGEIRGTYLVSISAAWVASQLIASFIIVDSEYWKIFFVSALLVIPVLAIIYKNFRSFSNPPYTHTPFFKTLALAWVNKNIWNICAVNFLLQFFYAWMVIYTPLYLHTYIGFNWQMIALMFSIMLLPFVITERPLGKIADRWLGEKELLVGGFAIMLVTTAAMSFIVSADFMLWTALLFTSRIGASMVEVMSETYFFKQVADKDAALIGLFRTTRPWAYIISPLLATILLPFVGVQYLFVILAGFMLYGIRRSLLIRDTR